jgi:putative hydrolase of the HAD superfamily
MFIDIGEVLLSDGWGHLARLKMLKKFRIEPAEFENRHRMNFEIYEQGKITLDQYLDRVIFYRSRAFTRAQVRRFIFDQSTPYPKMIKLITQLKLNHRLKILVVSNEGRELNDYRIREFGLTHFVDGFISSCYVHLRKPDTEIFRLALDIGQVKLHEVVYIDNTPMFVEIAESIGIRSILHKSYDSTKKQLASVGLEI